MAELDVTYHSTSTDTWGGTGALGIIPPQVGNADALDFTSGTDEGAVDADNGRIACFIADADCRIAVGESVTATALNSRKVIAGQRDFAFIPKGHRLSVIAA